MPYENEDPLPNRKFYLDEEVMDEVAIFVVEESIRYYIRDKKSMPKEEFDQVYEGFDPWKILSFCIWLNKGYESSYQETLREALTQAVLK